MKHILLVGFLSAVALGAWGCGSDDDGDGSANGGNGGGNSSGNGGGESTATAACLNCLGSKCQNQLAACPAETCAASYLACVTPCNDEPTPSDKTACIGTCAADNQPAVALIACGSSECVTECESLMRQ